VVQFAGLFLIHRALATLELLGTLPLPATHCLQVGRTLIADPERAGSAILGSLS
jgi:hypothetical protein